MRGVSLRVVSLVALSVGVAGAASSACSASSTPGEQALLEDGGTDGGFALPDGGAPEGGGGGFEAGDNLAKLEPNNATIFIDTSVSPLVGGTQSFVFKKPSGEDITASATFSIEPSTLGTFSGATFTSVTDLPGGVLGVTGLVTAIAPGEKGEAKVTVVKLRKSEDPTTKSKDFFFEEPHLGTPSPTEDILKFTTQINQVDVAIVQDTSGSMGGEIANLQASIKGTLIPELKKQIPSVGIGIAGHDDYPVGGYGSSGSCSGTYAGDIPVYVIQRITTDDTAAKSAVDKLRRCFGNDGPESQLPALWHVLTGNALNWSGGSIPAHTPPAGFTGGMNFRPGAVPVLVLITDAPWHNGVSSASTAYGSTVTSPPTMPALVDAFNKAGAKFVGIHSQLGDGDPKPDGNHLSDNTNSNVPPSAFGGACGAGQCCTGLSGAGKAPDAPGGNCRLNFEITGDGTGLGNSVVTAIKAIASGSVYDLLPEVSNDPANPDGVDAVSAFMDRLEAVKPGEPGVPAECAGTPRKSDPSKAYDDMIGGITAGKQVACFKVIPKQNTTVEPKETAQFFKASIRMRGVAPGTTPVGPTTPTIDLGDERTVLFYVPPKAPGGIK